MANIANKIIYPELSYEILGASFAVFNKLGYGLRESTYQDAFSQELNVRKILHTKEQPTNLEYKGKTIRRFADFVIESRVVVELKIAPKLGYTHIRQVVDYLSAGNYKLAILIYFTREGIKYRRVLNPNHRA